MTDGPYAETKEQMGGFWIIEAPDLDAALDWAVLGRGGLRGSRRGPPDARWLIRWRRSSAARPADAPPP